jgi:hypothetical protein
VDQVTAMMGNPTRIVDLGTKKICALRFLYIKVLKRPDMKEDLLYTLCQPGYEDHVHGGQDHEYSVGRGGRQSDRISIPKVCSPRFAMFSGGAERNAVSRAFEAAACSEVGPAVRRSAVCRPEQLYDAHV